QRHRGAEHRGWRRTGATEGGGPRAGDRQPAMAFVSVFSALGSLISAPLWRAPLKSARFWTGEGRSGAGEVDGVQGSDGVGAAVVVEVEVDEGEGALGGGAAGVVGGAHGGRAAGAGEGGG